MNATRLIEELVPSAALGGHRTVRVYLPLSYSLSAGRRYPVLFLHDGQNVFSSAGPDCCFGWGSWELDRTVDRLSLERRMSDVILVAVDNSRYRYQEYRGPSYRYSKAALAALKQKPSGANDDSRFRRYVSFLVDELKPRIDREFRTLPGPAATGLMGSSLGGIASFAIAWENPDVFGLAACLSSSFQVERSNFLRTVLRPYRRAPQPIRFYLDSGVIDYSGGDDGLKQTVEVAKELQRIGWKDDLRLFIDDQPLSELELAHAGLRPDKRAEAVKSQHNEFYWRFRAWRALTYLFPPAGARGNK